MICIKLDDRFFTSFFLLWFWAGMLFTGALYLMDQRALTKKLYFILAYVSLTAALICISALYV